MGTWSLVVITLVYVFIDHLFTVGLFGFYHPRLYFSTESLFAKLLLRDTQGRYSFIKSPLDFEILATLRSLVLFAGIIYTAVKRRVPRLDFFFLGAGICNCSYSLVKVLAFSDTSEQLYYWGVWGSLVWNVVSFLLLGVLWTEGYIKRRRRGQSAHSGEYGTLVEEPQNYTNGGGDALTAAVNGEVRSGPSGSCEDEASERASTLSHVLMIFKYCGYYWKWLAAGFGFLVFYSAARIFIPLYTARVIANVVSGAPGNVFFESVMTMAILMVISTVFGGLRGGCFNYATSLITRRLRRDLFRSITSQEIAFFDQTQTGEILSRLTADVEAMSASVANNVNVILRNVLMVIGSVSFMAVLSWRLTLVTLVVVPPIAFCTKIYAVFFDQFSETIQKRLADANRLAEEVIGSMRTVRSFACEKKECARYEQHLESIMEVARKKALAYVGFTWVNEFSNSVILIAVLTYGGYLTISGRMTSSDIIAFLLYQMQLGENFYLITTQNLKLINQLVASLMENVGASRKVFEYLHRQPEIPNDGTLKLAEDDFKGAIQFKDVCFSYPTRPAFPVLQNINFTIEPGETLALVGPSGAGKSSVISLLEHFYEAAEGEILIDGVQINRFDHLFYHQKVALVAQEPVLYSGSIRFNILYGCEEWAGDVDMIEAAKLANIHDFVVENPLGYDTKCGEKGVQMSGGQKQRIAIARALVRKPVVLILDEATSALDSESEHIIQEALRRCSVGRTVIVIAHRLSTVENADRILVVDKGRIVQCGTHKALMDENDGLYQTLVHRQLLNVHHD